MKTLTTIVILLVILVGGGYWYLSSCQSDSCLFLTWQKERVADSFERCQALGFPVMESYPRQCRAGGKTFTEEITQATSTSSLPDGNTGGVDSTKVVVDSPQPNALVKSPLQITGKALGTWYFEASFPVRVLDANGKELGVIPAQAQSDWMTTGFVPFKANIIFAAPTTLTGTLVLQKDNPSGLPENEDAVLIPIRFK